MIVYNTTIKINKSIHEAWTNWLLQEHIPEIMKSKLFSSYAFYKLLEQEDSEGPTFVLQFFTQSIDTYRDYMDMYAPALRKKEFEKWGLIYVAFTTLLETVQ